jgi:hypothetical protein
VPTEPRRVYLDTEFLKTDPTRAGLVTLGLYDDTGRSYYAINADMDTFHVYTQVERDGTYWMRDNVWCHLPTLAARPDRLDYAHPDIKAFEQIRDEVAAYFTTGEETHVFAYYGASDMSRLWSLWNNDWTVMPRTIPTWHWELRAEQSRAGDPDLPPHPGRPHHALDDAQHDRLIHEHLLTLGAHQACGTSR